MKIHPKPPVLPFYYVLGRCANYCTGRRDVIPQEFALELLGLERETPLVTIPYTCSVACPSTGAIGLNTMSVECVTPYLSVLRHERLVELIEGRWSDKREAFNHLLRPEVFV